jgi:hypothetical protein
MKWAVCILLSAFEVGESFYLVRSQKFPQTFSSVQKTDLNDSKAADKDYEIPCKHFLTD